MFSSCAKDFVRVISLLALCMVFTVAAMAQSTTSGAIAGTTTDSQGAVVVDATVRVKNLGTNQEFSAKTDGTGRFVIGQLIPGDYSVEITAPGFSTWTSKKVTVEVGRATALEITLKVGGQGESIEVTTDAPIVDTANHDFNSNINQNAISELPINGRRWSNFALLTPGATPDGNFGLISFRGISGLLNNSTVDGGDNNQAFFSEERGRTRIGYVVSQAAIREFQVNTSNYSAEYGRAAGGVVNAVTDSGTNSFHAKAFWYIRDNELGARNPFSNRTVNNGGVFTSQPFKARDQRHQFGATIGGPIVKNKAFFFFSWDQQRRDFPGVAAAANPGQFFAPFSASELATFTARGITPAQQTAGLTYVASLLGEVPRRGDQLLLLPKVDWNINQRNVLSVSYNRLRWNSPAGVQTQPVVTRGIASFGDDIVEVDSVNARLTSTISSAIVNEFRFQYGRDNELQISQPPGPGEPATGPGGRSPQVAIFGGGPTLGKPNFLERTHYPLETRLQFADNISMTKGRHNIKFGVDFNHVNDLLDSLFTQGGSYSYNNRVDFISDFIDPAGKRYSSFAQGFGPSAFQFSTMDYNAFVQDNWRVSQSLTINAGMRYEYQRLPQAQIPNPLYVATNSFPADVNNFGPRIGFGWDMTGDGKTSVRGGYGIYYGRIVNSAISNAITNTGVAAGQLQFSFSPTSVGSPVYPNVVPTAPALTSSFRPDIVVFSRNQTKNPLIHQMDFVVEREILPNTVVSVSYLASFGRNLPTFFDINLASPTTTTTFSAVGGALNGRSFTVPRYTARINPNFARITEIRNSVESKYQALVIQANRRMSRGLQFQMSYTLADSTDNGQNSQTFTTGNAPIDPLNDSWERGKSDFLNRHRFISSVIWQPKFFQDNRPVAKAIFNGFTISPIVSIASGKPYSATTSGNAPGSTSNALTGLVGAGGSSRLPFFQRNSFNFPTTANVDMRISRRFGLGEKMNLELLAEAFNLFNRQNITDLATRAYSISGTTLTADTTFGNPTGAGNTIFRERQVQFGIRFAF